MVHTRAHWLRDNRIVRSDSIVAADIVCWGLLAVRYSWSIEVFFAGVAIGLALVGIGLALCMRSNAWRPDRQIAQAKTANT